MWSLVAIIVTGASVRLTGSGLGCSDWPNCEPGQLVPESDVHGWVEFGNRLITGLVSLAVVLAVSLSLRRSPRDRSLTMWSLGLVAGVAGQIALGAVTVLTHLSPPIVMAHFLLSIVLVWNAVVLHHLAAPEENTVSDHTVPGSLVRMCWAVAGVATVVIVTGTMVTAAGPHGGDEDVERLDIALPDAARIHGICVVILIVSTLWLWRRVRRDEVSALRDQLGLLLSVMGLQAVIGYVQYFSELPVVLVGMHIAGATALWIAVVRLVLVARSQSTPIGSAAAPTDGAGATGTQERDFAQ